MRFLHVLLFALGAICSAAAQELPYPVYEGICEHDPQSFSITDVQERKCISQTGASAARDGDRLHLKFRDGAERTYQDKPYQDNEERRCDLAEPYATCRDYMLYDYFPEHDLFLIRVMCWESDEWHLVRQRNGTEELIVAPPRYSPDRKWLAAVHWSEGPLAACGPDDNGNNGIDIVPSMSDPAIPSFHYRTNSYALFEFVRWDGNDRLVTKVTMPDPAKNPADQTFPVEVVRENGAWHLKWPLPGPPP
jgi:hypothetical protein